MNGTHRFRQGFTLIEMLVVLVIIAITTGLLVSGLSTTWKNFESLTARNIAAQKLQLPVHWFTQSIQAAQTFHPFQQYFSGTADALTFNTVKAPDIESYELVNLQWQIKTIGESGKFLVFASNSNTPIAVMPLPATAVFDYLAPASKQWVSEFLPDDGLLPLAVRVRAEDTILAISRIYRPAEPEFPPELREFGVYEF